MVMAMRVAGDKEGEGSKVTAMATRVVGKQMVMATRRAVAIATREVGKEEASQDQI
jgi:hypothetical protein